MNDTRSYIEAALLEKSTTRYSYNSLYYTLVHTVHCPTMIARFPFSLPYCCSFCFVNNLYFDHVCAELPTRTVFTPINLGNGNIAETKEGAIVHASRCLHLFVYLATNHLPQTTCIRIRTLYLDSYVQLSVVTRGLGHSPP